MPLAYRLCSVSLLERAELLDELAALRDRAAGGRGVLLFVSGEAGIGKTSLVSRFRESTGDGVRVLWGQSDPLSTPSPLGPLRDIASQLAEQRRPLPPPEAPRADLFSASLATLAEAPSLLERARALGEGDTAAQVEALATFDRLGARPAADRLRQALRSAGARSVPRGPRAATRANRYGLTAREIDVLDLLAQGLTNPQIAQRNHRSVRTVDHQVAAILGKLGADSRAAAVARARKQRLIATERRRQK